MLRSGAVDESARGTTGESGVYDYSRGEYTGESYEERPLGERAPIGDDLTRSMGNQTYKAGYIGSSRRSAGDFTGASSSPYPATSSYFAPTYITDPFLSGKRNIKLGPVNIGMGLSANIEYNDNITQSGDVPLARNVVTTGLVSGKDAAGEVADGPVSDFIVGTYLNMDANWQFSQKNRLTVAMTLGFDRYINHPELAPNSTSGFIDQEGLVFNVLPGSTLAFDFSVGDVMFTVYDRMSVRPSTNSQFQVANEDQFGAFQNDLGLAVNWAINSKLNFSLNFNRSDVYETDDEVTAQTEFVTGARQAPANAYNRTINTLSGSLAWTPTGTYTIGLEGSLSNVDYEETYQNDSTTSTAGVFVIAPITRSTILKASGGWQRMEFDTPAAFKATADKAGTDAQIASLEAQKAAIAATGTTTGLTVEQVTEQMAAIDTQIAALNADLAAKTAADNLSFRSNTRDTASSFDDYYYNVVLFNQLNARISHQLSFGHEASLNTNSNYILADYVSYGVGVIAWRGSRISLSSYYESSQESGGSSAEDIKQWGIDAMVSHRLTDRITVGVGYHFGDTDSDVVGDDYVQNAISLDFSYVINRKLTMGLGYRYLTTDSETETESFDQNRVTMSMNYNF